MTDRRIRTQVAIVGGGPVGMGLAIGLGQLGIECAVIERRTEPQPVPKGQNLTQRTMEHMRAWGAEDRVRAGRTIPREHGIVGYTAYGSLLGPYSYEWQRRATVRRFYATDNERLPQYATERALRERVAEVPAASVHYGWRADEVTQDDAGARVRARDESGDVLDVDADRVVGCDGSRSLVRAAAGITEARTDHDQMMVLLVFRSEQLDDVLERFPGRRTSTSWTRLSRVTGSSSGGSTRTGRGSSMRRSTGPTPTGAPTSAPWSGARSARTSTSTSSTSASGT